MGAFASTRIQPPKSVKKPVIGLRDAGTEVKFSTAVSTSPPSYLILNDIAEQASRDWAYDILKLEAPSGNRSLEFLGRLVLETHGVYSALQLDSSQDAVAVFLRDIQEGYQLKPYHNALHATDTMFSVHGFLRHGLSAHLNSFESVMALLAAIIHDFKHEGVNNSFLAKSEAPLVSIYGEHSVLEKMHISEAFRVMDAPGCALLHHLPCTKQAHARRLLTEAVLATDMAAHGTLLTTFESQVLAASQGGQHTPVLSSATSMGADEPFMLPPGRIATIDQSAERSGSGQPAGLHWNSGRTSPAIGVLGGGSSSGRASPAIGGSGRASPACHSRQFDLERQRQQLLVNMAVHCADIGTAVKPPAVYGEWAARVFTEFYAQGDREKELALPVTPFFDRTGPASQVGECQTRFLELLCAPLFRTWAEFLPFFRVPFEANLQQNLALWRPNGAAALTANPPSPFALEVHRRANRLSQQQQQKQQAQPQQQQQQHKRRRSQPSHHRHPSVPDGAPTLFPWSDDMVTDLRRRRSVPLP